MHNEYWSNYKKNFCCLGAMLNYRDKIYTPALNEIPHLLHSLSFTLVLLSIFQMQYISFNNHDVKILVSNVIVIFCTCVEIEVGFTRRDHEVMN